MKSEVALSSSMLSPFLQDPVLALTKQAHSKPEDAPGSLIQRQKVTDDENGKFDGSEG